MKNITYFQSVPFEKSNGGRNYSVRKGAFGEAERNNQPYAGVIIEEMLESASMHNGDYPVALIEEQPGGTREPEVSLKFLT